MILAILSGGEGGCPAGQLAGFYFVSNAIRSFGVSVLFTLGR
jgi:hypothetical protein